MEEYKVLLRFNFKQDKKELIVPKEDYELIINHNNYNKCCLNGGCIIKKLLINYENIVDYYKNGINENNILDIVNFFVYFKMNEKLIEIFSLYFSSEISLEINSVILFYAVDNIKFDIIKLVLSNITNEEELVNMFYFLTKQNILEHICSCHGSTVNSNDLTKLSTKRIYKGKVEEDVVKITEILLQKSNKLVTDKCFTLCRLKGHEEIIDLMNLYLTNDITTDENLKECYVCLTTTEQDKIINGVCKCDTYIHTHCLQKLIKTQREIEKNKENIKCKICDSCYNYNRSVITKIQNGIIYYDTSIFFPENNFYPVPLMTKQFMFFENIRDKLKLSMFYLCIPQFIKNIELVTKEEFNDFIKEQIKYSFIKKEDTYKLCENMPSNYQRKYNEKKYFHLEKIINKKMNEIV